MAMDVQEVQVVTTVDLAAVLALVELYWMRTDDQWAALTHTEDLLAVRVWEAMVRAVMDGQGMVDQDLTLKEGLWDPM